MGKRISPKSEWGTGVSDLGAFILDYLQPVKLVLSQKLPPFCPIYWGLPFHISSERERKEQGLKMGKGNPSKVHETRRRPEVA